MSETDVPFPGQGLILEDNLPLRWRSGELPALSVDNNSNEEVLRFIDVLEEYPSDSADEHTPLAQDVARVEAKLNLLLGLIGQLITLNFPLPPNKTVTVSPLFATWLGDEDVRLGMKGVLDLYLSPRCPRPLSLSASIQAVEDTGGLKRITVQFIDISPSIRERLEKIIFRHHRRRIALSRRKTTAESKQTS